LKYGRERNMERYPLALKHINKFTEHTPEGRKLFREYIRSLIFNQ